MHWRFKFYRPEDGQSQPQVWYERQTKTVRARFDAELFRLSLRKSTPEADSLGLPGYTGGTGLLEIVIEIDLPDVMKVMVVGFWQEDSPNFVVIFCCEEIAGDYDPPLYQALELKKAWDNRKGEIYDHIAADEPTD